MGGRGSSGKTSRGAGGSAQAAEAKTSSVFDNLSGNQYVREGSTDENNWLGVIDNELYYTRDEVSISELNKQDTYTICNSYSHSYEYGTYKYAGADKDKYGDTQYQFVSTVNKYDNRYVSPSDIRDSVRKGGKLRPKA